MKGPWDTPDDHATLVAYEEFRQYRALNRRYDRAKRRQHLLRQFGWPVLAAVGGGAIMSAYLLLAPLLSFGSSSSPEVRVWRGGSGASQSSASFGFSSCRWFWQQNCVIDGDTIRYQGEKIRLVGIDTPEIFSPKCDYELELGRKAKARLIELMSASPFVIQPTAGPDVDQYGRKLRDVTRNGRSIGDALIAEGLARPWRGSRLPWC